MRETVALVFGEIEEWPKKDCAWRGGASGVENFTSTLLFFNRFTELAEGDTA
jgi:hypothetical protein